MNRRALRLAIAALILGPISAAEAAPPKSFFGVVPQAYPSVEDFDRMAEAGVGTLRFMISWADTDRSAEAGDLDWGASDRLVGEAAARGMQPLPFVYGSPGWVAALDRHACPRGCAAHAPRSRAALAAWRSFLRAAAGRYGPGGIFWKLNPTARELPVYTWQLWNEQNSPSFYMPRPDVGAYARLVAAGSSAIHAVDAEAEIVLGGMFGTPLGGRKPGIAAHDFLAGIYRVASARRSFDGVAAHPYAARFSDVRAQVRLLRTEMRRAGDAGSDLWITELGWASGGTPHPLNRGLAGQANRLTRALEFFRANRNKLNLRGVSWYSWRDNPEPDDGLCVWCPESGLVEDDLTAKPSLKAWKRFTRGD